MKERHPGSHKFNQHKIFRIPLQLQTEEMLFLVEEMVVGTSLQAQGDIAALQIDGGQDSCNLRCCMI